MTRGVLHVIPSVAPRDGGPSIAVLGMCRALMAAGYPAAIATTDADGPARLPVDVGRPHDYQGVPTIFFARTATTAFKWSPSLASWLERHVSDYDLVHVHAVFSHAAIAAGRACRRAGVPYLVRPLGTLDPWSLAQKRWRKRVLLSIGARRLLQGAGALHYTTAEEGRLAGVALGGLPRGVVVPIGVDDEWFDLPTRSRQEPPRLLSLSRLHPKKGIDKLIVAFQATVKDPALRSWRLTIAGDGDPEYTRHLQRLATEGGAGDRIQFAGWVEREDKRRLMAEASLFVLPSSQENFGIAVAEAMASGLPVVLTSQVNLAADVRDAGAGWIADTTPDALPRVLHEAMIDTDGRRRCGERARYLAGSFRWPAIGAMLIQTYEALTGESAARSSFNESLSPLPARSASRH